MRINKELTHREKQVLALIAMGYTRAAAGKELFLTEDTIKTHLRRVATFYGTCASAPLLVIEAVRRGDIAITGRCTVVPTNNISPSVPEPRRTPALVTR